MLKYLGPAALAAALAFAPSAFPQTTPVARMPDVAGLSLEPLAHLEAALGAEVKQGRLPGAVVLVAREMTIQDLLRHSSGLTSGARGSPVRQAYLAARTLDLDQSNAELVAKIAALPLAYQPGTTWEYGQSTAVLGALIERVTGQPLDVVLETRILKPLGMNDTAFHVPEAKHGRIAEALANDPESGRPIRLLDVRKPPRYLGAGGGMVSTAHDYSRFVQMLLNGGALDGVRLLSRKTVEYMTSDHLGAVAHGPAYYPGAGYGFGLGFAVRIEAGAADAPGSVGDYTWAGFAGTYFWVDPRERPIGILTIQSPTRGYWRLMRSMVYAALVR